MNVLFLTQSRSLSVFCDLAGEMLRKTELGKVGFYVADSLHFEEFSARAPELLPGKYELLKEWEIIRKSADLKPDLTRLREYEERLGDPVLWNALLADRRIYLGRKATIEQDYPSRFDHERMMAILQVAVEEMEALFDRVQPDLVVSFICVTIGDYLGYLVAKSRGIRFLNLRPTRIKNYFFAGEDIFEPSKQLEAAYRRLLEKGVPDELRRDVDSYLETIRSTHAMYEGVIPASGPVSDSAAESGPGFLRKLGRLARMYLNQLCGKYRYDTHYDGGVLYPEYFNAIGKPLRKWRLGTALRRHYVRPEQLPQIDYTFYPLHKEPEVTLLVYSRPCLNQIEVVRNLARSLPVGMKLLIKEHPAALGYRRLGYYRKLLEIPGVLLAPPEMESRKLVENARLVAVISGSVGLEALMVKKPVVLLGGAPFAFLPESMLRWVREPQRLARAVTGLLANHRHDENAVTAYVAAVMDQSVPVNFYSVLLARKGVFTLARGGEEQKSSHVSALADYLLRPEPGGSAE